MAGIGYISGAYDILRQKDLEKLDKAVQKNQKKGNDYFAIAVYDDKLCEDLGLGEPLKSAEDRVKIAEYIDGVDFAFSISSMKPEEIAEKTEKAFKEYKEKLKEEKDEEKEFDIVYAPGTFDLFHAGHLENLLEASKRTKKLIVGVKSDELVQKHKGRMPRISAQERMEIMRHFKFVDGVYKYYTRDPHVAAKWIKRRYKQDLDAIFMGSDLRDEFRDIEDIRMIFTERDEQLMKSRSTTAYTKKMIKSAKKDKNLRYTRATELKKIEIRDDEER